jgi:methionyl-tRNA formyltransferase
MRLLVFSQIADWDFGPRLKASGHDIAAWVRPTWEQGPPQAVSTIRTTILSRPKSIQARQPRFDTRTWLDHEKIPRIPCPNVNAPQFIEYVKSLNIDLIVVCIFPQILKAGILQTPRLGVFNCHPSLLPRYGGPEPGFWMIKNGESVAGVTVHVMTEKIDAGAIVAQQELIIGENENAGELLQRQHYAAATLLIEAVNAMAQGTINPRPQNIAERSYFGKKKVADTTPDWNGSARQMYNLLRALQPDEPLIAYLNGHTIRIFDARPQEGSASWGVPGEILTKQSGTLLVRTGNGCLDIRSYEIGPYHGWINRMRQEILLPLGSRFDLAPPATGPAPKAVP